MSDSLAPAYTRTARWLHWLVAAMILVNIGVGLYMETFPKQTPGRDAVFFYHASIGMLVLWVVVVRLLWRWTHTPPPLPGRLPAWQRLAAHALHGVLYALLLAVPAVGYVHRLAGAHPVSFFGLFNWPMLIGRNEPLRVFTDTLHELLVGVLVVLAMAHVTAALKHRLIDRDGIAERMLRL